jgi:hypothetical protein
MAQRDTSLYPAKHRETSEDYRHVDSQSGCYAHKEKCIHVPGGAPGGLTLQRGLLVQTWP